MPPPKHVILNALYLAPGVSGGPETYLRGLAPALAQAMPQTRLTVLSTGSGTAALAADQWRDFCDLVSLPCEDGQRVRRLAAEQALLPWIARSREASLVHSLANVAPLAPGVSSVLTLHDVIFMVTPTFGRLTTAALSFFAKRAMRYADEVITVSAASRVQICAVLGADPSRFTVVHNGFKPPYSGSATPARDVRERYDLGTSTIVLCIGTKRPHKNQEVLLRAMPMLGADTKLLLAGHPEPYETRLRELATTLVVEERVRFLDHVSDADLEGLWHIADCCAAPSLAEGFGLPVLESLSRGVPVAASEIPTTVEIGGSLPHYFNPHDSQAAAHAIEAALADTTVRDLGPAHAARFSWENAAAATVEVYERALARHR